MPCLNPFDPASVTTFRDFIPRRRFDEAYNAVCFANFEQHVLSVELTINFEQMGYVGQEVDEAYQAFVDRFRHFTNHRRLQCYYYAAFENGRRRGLHCHMGLHVPCRLRHAFRMWLKSTLRCRDGGQVPDGAYWLKHNGDSDVIAQWRWFQYAMKDVEPELTRSEMALYGETTFHVAANIYPQAWGERGVVAFDRVRVARWLGPKCRRTGGYGRDLKVLMVHQDYRYGKYQLRRKMLMETADFLNNLEVF